MIRGKERIPASGWVKLQPGDVLIMQGPVPTIGDLLKSPDFQLKEEVKMDDQTLRSVDLVTVEAMLAPHSDYLGNTLEQMDFSHDYGFTVMGISRHGKTIRERPMATPLQYGDSLLLLGHVSRRREVGTEPESVPGWPPAFSGAGQEEGGHDHAAAVGSGRRRRDRGSDPRHLHAGRRDARGAAAIREGSKMRIKPWTFRQW